MEKNEVVKELLKNGAELVKGLKVRNITVTPQPNYVRVAISFDKKVKGMVSDDGVNYTQGETNVIFVSLYSITSILKDNDDAAFAVNHIIKNPDSIQVILSRATIDIIQETVVSGQEYKNPWSDSAEMTVFDHDTIINHIVEINLSDFGKKGLDMIMMSMLKA